MRDLGEREYSQISHLEGLSHKFPLVVSTFEEIEIVLDDGNNQVSCLLWIMNWGLRMVIAGGDPVL